MKTLLAIIAPLLVCASGHARQPVVLFQQPQLVTLATGVQVLLHNGTATIVAAPFVYNYAQAAAGYQPQVSAAELKAFRDWKAAKTVKATAVQSLVAVNCAKCHGGAEPKGGLDLTAPLTTDVRLKAIRRVLIPLGQDDHMPKGKTLKLADVGPLIQELAGKKAKFPPTESKEQ